MAWTPYPKDTLTHPAARLPTHGVDLLWIRPRRGRRGGPCHDLQRLPELVAEMRPSADEQAGNRPVAADDDSLRDRIGPVLLGHEALDVERDRRRELVPFEHG